MSLSSDLWKSQLTFAPALYSSFTMFILVCCFIVYIFLIYIFSIYIYNIYISNIIGKLISNNNIPSPNMKCSYISNTTNRLSYLDMIVYTISILTPKDVPVYGGIMFMCY